MKPIIRCSSLNQLLSCHGSRTLRQIALEKFGALAQLYDEDEMSSSGSWTHYHGAIRLITEHKAVGEPEMPAGQRPLVDKFEQWVEDYYVDTVMSYTHADHAIAVEQRLTMDCGRFILTGQLDCFTINADATEADINDLKTGYTKVDAADSNWQLLGYLVLLLVHYPTLKKVRLRIIQPRNEPEERISEVEIDVTPGLEAELVGRINAALDDEYSLETGPKQCRWCVAQLICPALKLLRQSMKAKLTKESVAALAAASDYELLGEWVRDSKVLAAPIDSATKLVKAALEKENIILLEDGTELSLKPKNGKRTVPDPATAKTRLEENGIDFMACISVSVGDVEEQAYKKGVLIDGERVKLPKSSKDPKVLTAPLWVERNFSDLYEQKVNQELVIQ